MNIKENLLKKLPISAYPLLKHKSPHSLQIEITTQCNLSCRVCPRHTFKDFNPDQLMSYNLYEKIINESAQHMHTVYLWGVGEPLLHPRFFEMVSLAKSHNLKVIFTTNGTLLNKHNINQIIKHQIDDIIFSVDGTKSLKSTRGVTLHKLSIKINNLRIEKIQQKSTLPHTHINFILMKQNKDEIPDFLQWASSLKIPDIKFQNLLTWDEYTTTQSRIFDNDTNITLPSTSLTPDPKCTQPFIGSPNIRVDGKVTPCCFLAYPLDTYFIRNNGQIKQKKTHFEPLIMGDVNNDNILTIWNNDAYTKLRKSFTSKNTLHPCDICLNQDGVIC